MPNDDDFLNIPYADCIKLLLSEAIITGSADGRCIAAITWLNYDSVGRAAHLSDILNSVPFTPGEVSVDVVLEASKSEMFWANAPEMMRKILEGMLTQTKIEHPATAVVGGSGGASNSSDWYVVGGTDTASFLKFDVNRRSWLELPTLPWTRKWCGACAVGNRLVVMGGKKNIYDSADIDEYDLLNCTWSTTAAQVGEAPCCTAVCSDGLFAYTFGGVSCHHGWSSMSTNKSRRYCRESKEVVNLSDMSSKRANFAAVPTSTGHSNKSIFIAGGCTALIDYTSIEKYEISADKWTKVGDIAKARYGLAATFSGDDLYLIGGRSDEGDLDVVEIFNARTGQVRFAPKLLHRREGCSAATMCGGNVVCVMGDYRRYSRSVEVYDVREGKWSTGVVVPDMPKQLGYFGFVAL